MRWNRTLPMLLTVLLAGAVVRPSAGVPADDTSQDSTPRDQGSLAALYERGQAHLHNLDYEAALEVFDRALDAAPDHPGPYTWKATALWTREMFQRGEFDLRRYLDVSRFEGEDDGNGDETEEERSRLTRRVFGLVDRGLERAEAWSADPERRTEGLYYRGLLLGVRAGYRTLVLREFLDAVGDTKESVSLHRKVLEADPSFIDPYYSLGTYNYVERRAAVTDYRAVLDGPDVEDAHERAEEYLDEPYETDGR